MGAVENRVAQRDLSATDRSSVLPKGAMVLQVWAAAKDICITLI
ncbi:hypothetical protein COMA2_110159 [Candidatus Nitrospira nitrificans]|uniref:Uncharacterized protein n=1 Tax=Candidatus Nitrospira nitrificans TaxID=1742973 RepID=A0A0S4L5D0_9BACT|nr:hypothetical protein COMA2_110159 [Candidatus Nitrospira nitrificans]